MGANNGRVRVAGEIAHRRRMPMISTRRAIAGIHTLLHHGPLTFVAHNEGVQIELKPIRNCIVVDFCSQAAGPRQRIATHPRNVRERAKLLRRLPRLFATPAANVDPQLMRPRIEPTFQRAHDRSRNSRRMPIHPHHATKRLEPERIAQARQ